jgi:hypothetical protein
VSGQPDSNLKESKMGVDTYLAIERALERLRDMIRMLPRHQRIALLEQVIEIERETREAADERTRAS